MYHTWATKLTAMGWAVVAHDHAGAGYTVHRDCRRDALPTNGKDCLIDVARVARRFIHQHYPHQPVVAYGHSMGALMVMSAINHLPPTAGVILTGSTCEPHWRLALKSAALRFFYCLPMRYRQHYWPMLLRLHHWFGQLNHEHQRLIGYHETQRY